MKGVAFKVKRQVFYSFHYEEDVRRVALIRNIGAIEGNKVASDNEWEEVKRGGDEAIKRWIDKNMEYRSCIIVLIGEHTADRKWINYEIKHAWETSKALLGIYIHNIKDPLMGKSIMGDNPFKKFTYQSISLANIVPVYNPNANDAYNDIRYHLEEWIEKAIEVRNKYK